MKDLKDMSWSELTKLREQLNEDLGDDHDSDDGSESPDVSEDTDNLVKSYDDDRHEWIEGDLIDALAALHEIQEAAPSVKKGAPKSPPKGYPSDKSKYADPTNFKYPLDTEKHVRAALAYFSKASNRSKGGYSPQEQKFMWKRIIAAAKKYDIQLSDDVKKHAEKLGEASRGSDAGEVITTEIKEAELAELIKGIVAEQMKQNPGGALNQGKKGSGGMEVYQPQTRLPPDIEAINTQLEAFKQLHAKHEAANTDMATKMNDLLKQVQSLTETVAKLQHQESATSDSDTSDTDTSDSDGKNTEAKAAKSAKAAKGTDESKAAGTKKTGKGKDQEDTSDTSDSDGDGKTTEKVEKKVKEQMKQGEAHALVATTEMSEGNGTNPPGFGAGAGEEPTARMTFGERMNRASKMRRRGIGS